MSDGIKFMIDLDSRTQGAAAADTALSRVEHTAERANRNVSRGSHEFSVLKSHIFDATLASELWGKAVAKGAELAVQGLRKVGDVIQETVSVAAGEKREGLSMVNLLGGKAAAEEALRYMDRFGELSEFNDDQVKEWGRELLNAGFRGQRWKDAMAAIADASSMAPDKIAGAEEALAALTRMQVTGKLEARGLMGLRLNIKDVTQELGDALGMTPERVEKGLREGSIPAARAYEAVLRSLEKKTGKALGEAGLSAGKTLDAKLTHLREFPQKIMKAVADSPGIEKIEHAFDRVLEAFDPGSPNGSKMVNGLGSLMDSVGTFLSETDWRAVGASIGGIASNLGKWIDPLSKIVGFMGKVLTGLSALPEVGERIGDYLAEKDAPEARKPATKANPRGFIVAAGGMGAVTVPLELPMDEMEKKQAAFDAKKEAAFAGMPASPRRGVMEYEDAGPVPVPMRLPEFPKGGGGGGGVTHIEGKAEVTVNVLGSNANTQEVAHAAKTGTEAGLTTALERQALHAGTRSARRKR